MNNWRKEDTTCKIASLPPCIRGWHVLDVPKSAPSYPPTILAPSLEYLWDHSGSSVSKYVVNQIMIVLVPAVKKGSRVCGGKVMIESD